MRQRRLRRRRSWRLGQAFPQLSRSQLTAAVMYYARYPEVIQREVEVTQFYRLMDQTNVSLLQILDCDVDLVVQAKSA